MEFNGLVSVVMPVHNGEKFLREAIESVLSQTYKNFELLIIENCSTDSTTDIIKSFNDERIILIIETDCGIVQGYNRGFREAKGEYILIHDQDDISTRNRLESQLEFLIANNLDLCGTGFDIINHNNELIKTITPPENQIDIVNQIFFNFFSLFNPTLLIKKQILIKLDYFDIKFPIGTDYDFLLRSLLDFKCGNNPNVLLKYRKHKNNTSSKNSKKGEKVVQSLAVMHLDNFKLAFDDYNYILARFYFFYGNYLTSSKYMLLSIKRNGLNFKKFKYLALSTIFVAPTFALRKRGLYYNKYINIIISNLRK